MEIQRTFSITTIGCKVNQYESQLIRENFLSLGLMESSGSPPDIFVINTCAVTSASEAKSRRAVTRAIRDCRTCNVIVTGCCADLFPAAFSSIPGVGRILGNELKARIPRELLGVDGRGVSSLKSFSGHTRAFVKIQDGCDSRCSYCVVPLARGAGRSREISEIVEEAEILASGGHAEIVLCGINLGSFGRDRGQPGALVHLIREMEKTDAIRRIRLSSIDPGDVSDELIALMKEGGKLCPHLHIPLQSGDDRVLKDMNRPYSAEDYAALIRRIRESIPDVSLTTDLMPGFPSEDEQAFANTLAMVDRASFSRVHIFPYSRRPGTAAWRLGDPVALKTKRRRHEILGALAERGAAEYRKRFEHRIVEVLAMGCLAEEPQIKWGLTREYLKIYFKECRASKGEIANASVVGEWRDGLAGEIVKINFHGLTPVVLA